MTPLARRLAALAIVALFGLVNFATQQKYVADATRRHWEQTLAAARALTALPDKVPVALALPDYALDEFVALYTRGHSTWVLDGLPGFPVFHNPLAPDQNGGPEIKNDGGAMKALLDAFPLQHFDLAPGEPGHRFVRFEPPRDLDLSQAVVVLPTRDESVVNGSQERPATGRFYVAKLADQRDTLVQVDSTLGRVIVPGHTDDVGLWQHEPDFVQGGAGLQGAGRHILFEVLGPVAGSRVLIDFTSAAFAAQGHALPSLTLYGDSRQQLAFAGRGTGRMLSAPIEPRELGGHYYVALDFDQAVAHFQSERSGLAGLYGAQLTLDTRGLIGFVRNISLLTPEQAATLDPPMAVSRFPAGLQAPGLLYSGVSEDGWVADKVWFQLAAPETGTRLRIKGDIPGLGPKLMSGVVKIRVDGDAVGEQPLRPGAIDLDLPVAPKSGPRRIELEATASEYLPKPDGRLVSFHLASIALEPRADAKAP